MALTPSHDDGFREIQLSGKQLVFLFMAVTVVLVVTFLTGVLVGRGVRAERVETAQAVESEAPAAPAHADVSTPADADPTKAAPPSPTGDDPADAKGGKEPAQPEEPPVAVNRNPTPQPKPVESVAKVEPPPAAPKPAVKAPVVAAAAAAVVAAATATPAAATPASAASAPASAATPVKDGYAVQVAAVNVRGEADAIVKRLSGKGYSAYVEVPKGSASTFRVRVGTFKTRREAQSMADKLKKEEKFKPWVTR